MKKRTWLYMSVLTFVLAGSIVVIGVGLFWPGIDHFEWDFRVLGASLALCFLMRPFVRVCSENWLEIWPVIGYPTAYIWLVASLLVFVASIATLFIRRWKIFPDWAHNLLIIAALVSFFFSLLNFRKWPPDG